MSFRRVSIEVSIDQTFWVCWRLTSRVASFENVAIGSLFGSNAGLTSSSAAGVWTWQWMSTVNWRCGAADRLIDTTLLRAAIAERHENSILLLLDRPAEPALLRRPGKGQFDVWFKFKSIPRARFAQVLNPT